MPQTNNQTPTETGLANIHQQTFPLKEESEQITCNLVAYVLPPDEQTQKITNLVAPPQGGGSAKNTIGCALPRGVVALKKVRSTPPPAPKSPLPLGGDLPPPSFYQFNHIVFQWFCHILKKAIFSSRCTTEHSFEREVFVGIIFEATSLEYRKTRMADTFWVAFLDVWWSTGS